MKINGYENIDDFFIKKNELYISERVYDYIKEKYLINNIQIDIQKNEFDDFILSLIEADKKKMDAPAKDDEQEHPPGTFSVFD